jgi:hypothetical protein
LLRIPQLEEDLWALGTVTFASLFEDQPEVTRPGLIRAHTFVVHGKRFDNLFLQESRLNRRYSTLIKQLGELKLQRQADEAEREFRASKSSARPNGFEFSPSPKAGSDDPLDFLPAAERPQFLKELNQKLAKLQLQS